MELIYNNTKQTAKLQTVLSQNLYTKVLPILEKLEKSKGAEKAYENLLQKRLLGDEYFAGKINLLKGKDAWNELKDDFRLQEIIGEVLLQVKTNIFEYITIDKDSIPLIFDLARICIDRKNIHDDGFLLAIDSASDSEFWLEQDLNGILEALKFFRSETLARVRTNF
ncbi:MAG: hypothetical protein ACKODS_09100 [Methylophilaceae bacterium]